MENQKKTTEQGWFKTRLSKYVAVSVTVALLILCYLAGAVWGSKCPEQQVAKKDQLVLLPKPAVEQPAQAPVAKPRSSAKVASNKPSSNMKRGIRVTNNTGAVLDVYYFQDNNSRRPVHTGHKVKTNEISEFPASRSELNLVFQNQDKKWRVHRTFQGDQVFEVSLP